MNTNRPPHFVNAPSLPGGLVMPTETAKASVLRLIKDRGGISTEHIYLDQLKTYSDIDRDPRGRVVSVAYIALVPWEGLSDDERASSSEVWWQDVETVPKNRLAYDHKKIFEGALARLAAKIEYTTIACRILPREFTLFDLQTVYEKLLGRTLDKRNFRKKIISLDIIKPLGKKIRGRRARPAELFSFRSNQVKQLEIL